MKNFYFWSGVGFSIAALAGVLWFSCLEHKRRMRRCKICGSKKVKRIPKFYRKSFRGALSDKEFSWQERTERAGGVLYLFYMFKVCLHCKRIVLERSDDVILPWYKLEWLRRRDPQCFVHKAVLFKFSNIPSPLPAPETAAPSVGPSPFAAKKVLAQ